jgi:hypothetical protein
MQQIVCREPIHWNDQKSCVSIIGSQLFFASPWLNDEKRKMKEKYVEVMFGQLVVRTQYGKWKYVAFVEQSAWQVLHIRENLFLAIHCIDTGKFINTRILPEKPSVEQLNQISSTATLFNNIWT